MKYFIIFLLGSFWVSFVSAQEAPPKKKGSFEFSTGLTILGPGSKMKELMRINGLNKTTNFLSWGSPTRHPNHFPIGLSFQLSYSRYFSSKSQLGLLASYSYLGSTIGAFDETIYILGVEVNSSVYLNVSFSNVSLIPIYTYELGPKWEVQTGPTLLINNAKTPGAGVDGSPEDYQKISPGLLFGINFKLWDSREACGKVSAQYIATTNNKMGPFSAGYPDNNRIVPESQLGYGHMRICFVLGIHH